MPRPKLENAESRLLTAGLSLFARHGTEHVNSNTIARRARLGVGTFYSHFPDKYALLREIELRTLSGLRQARVRAIRKASAEQITVDALGNWVQVSYYDDPASSTELDRYSRLYVNDGSLMIEHGELDSEATAWVSTVCGNVAGCRFSRNGRSAQMVLTLAEGSRQNTIVSSAYMHNE